MNVGWVHYRAVAAGAPWPKPLGDVTGVAKGYFKFAYFLRQALGQVEGLQVADIGEGQKHHARMALHLCPPHMFRPIDGRTNVLFTMWEGDALPPMIEGALKAAEYCVVPSRYCQRVWRSHGIEAACVPLGVADYYLAQDTSRPLLRSPGQRMRFLWLGSKLGRKGWQFLGRAWDVAFGQDRRDKQLYIKTIGDGTVKEYGNGDMLIDQRDVSEEELIALYRSSAVFLFPSFGEGFGLPALEAMATGCLAIAPEHSGLTEFINEYTAIPIEPGPPVVVDYGAKYETRLPTIKSLSLALRTAHHFWGTPQLETIRRSGTAYARRFTWDVAARRLSNVLTAIAERQEVPKEAVLVH